MCLIFSLAVSCYLGKANLNDLHTGMKTALTHELIWLVGEYMGRIYTEVKHRPHCIVANEENI